jgi:hypothetical protein
MPAARKPKTIERPIRWQIQPTAPATTRITAKVLDEQDSVHGLAFPKIAPPRASRQP